MWASRTARAAVQAEDGRIVCEACVVADTIFARLRGLLGRQSLQAGEGLLLRPAGAVHTAFMRFSIDVVFLDRTLEVISVAERLRPWRVAGRRRARAVLEIGAGEAAANGIRPGQRLSLSQPRQARDSSIEAS